MVGDVTRLTELGIGTDYSLLQDIGCFHSIPDAGATLLRVGFVRGDGRASRVGPRGLAPPKWRSGSVAYWYTIRRR
jgi:hypothetical protein